MVKKKERKDGLTKKKKKVVLLGIEHVAGDKRLYNGFAGEHFSEKTIFFFSDKNIDKVVAYWYFTY